MSNGAFSTIIIDEKRKRIIKTYIEFRGESDSPYLNLIGSNIYRINLISENDSHKRLLDKLPNMFPKIYNYEEKKYLEVEERPPIPEPLLDRNPEQMMLCRVEMDYLPYKSLNEVIFDLI